MLIWIEFIFIVYADRPDQQLKQLKQVKVPKNVTYVASLDKILNG